MVLLAINRQTMAACDQPLKKKQRIDAPDIEDGSDNSADGLADVFASTSSIPEELAARAGESPDSGTVSEDAVDCANVLQKIRNSKQCINVSVANLSPSDPPKPLCKSDWNSEDDELLSDIDILQDALIKQCLCGVEETVLRRPFSGHVKLTNWPLKRILKFLSNLQLTFDVYLRQNHNGAICTRLMDVCDALVRNEYGWIKEVTDLSDHKSKFVNYVASRVISSFLIVAKDSLDQNWLQQIVDNVYLFNVFDVITVRKINFSLDVIRRIVEWKDVELHPLEDTTPAPYVDGPNPFGNPTSSQMRQSSTNSQPNSNEFRLQAGEALQSAFSNLHTNSSAVSVNGEDSVAPNHSTFRLHEPVLRLHDRDDEESHEEDSHTDDEEIPTTNGRVERLNENGCLTVILTDSESFDTAYIKCLMIKTLEHHWLDLVKNVRLLLTRYINISNAENCILNFLSLWENIISVKANLSVIDTKPFYTDLESFVDLLRCTTLPSLIYTQLLGLLNEVLCYGSTLALQDLLPDETCMLAHCVVRFVKDYRLLNDVRIRNSRSGFSFVGFDSPLVVDYSLGEMRGEENSNRSLISSNHSTEANPNSDVALHIRSIRHEVDKTMLQKMALLVLKSVAVTVKEMRCDSSDSSIDSSDYNAIQDMQIVERSIRDVLKRLDIFIKNALEFHPETSFTKILIHLFSEQDDYLIESMVCTLDITVGIVYRNSVYPDLILMLNPVLTFVEFLKVVSHDSDVLLDYLVSNETCFLLYLLRFLKYVRRNWSKFLESCQGSEGGNSSRGLDETMSVLIRLRLQISRLVSKSLFPYNISPVLRLLEVCESLYEGNELS